MDPILVVWIVMNILAPFIILFCTNDEYDVGFRFVNPLFIYEQVKVNWFGCILITVILHILLPVVAVLYWLYKLCTVGRK